MLTASRSGKVKVLYFKNTGTVEKNLNKCFSEAREVILVHLNFESCQSMFINWDED